MTAPPRIRPGSPARQLPIVLRSALDKAAGGLGLNLGVVTAIPDAGHVTIEIGGSEITVPRLKGYAPVVGETACCLAARTTMIAIGALA